MLKDKHAIVIAVVALIALVVWVHALAPSGNNLKITVMDVGKGLCIVMRTPSGKTMVMDCGTISTWNNTTIGKSIVAPYLQDEGVSSIDVAVLSHPHKDHVSGFAGLLKEYPPKLVIDTQNSDKSTPYLKFLKAVKKSHATYRIAKRGQTIEMGDGISIQILSPPSNKNGFDLNNQSIVLRVVYKKSTFMLAADAGYPAEAEMIHYGKPLRAQVLQVGHHGSATSTSPEWLAAVKPQIAVISCGKRKKDGPSKQALDRLRAFGTRIYRTDRDGAVTFTSDGSTIKVSSMVSH